MGVNSLELQVITYYAAISQCVNSTWPWMFTLSDLLGQDLMVERFPQISDHRCPCSRLSRPGRQVPIERVVNGILVYLVQKQCYNLQLPWAVIETESFR